MSNSHTYLRRINMRKKRTKCNLFIENEDIGNKIGSPEDDSLSRKLIILKASIDFIMPLSFFWMNTRLHTNRHLSNQSCTQI